MRLEQCAYENALDHDRKQELRGTIEKTETLVCTIHDDLSQLIAATRSTPGPDRIMLSLWNLEAADDYCQLLTGQVHSMDALLGDLGWSVMTNHGQPDNHRELVMSDEDTSGERIFPFDEEILDSQVYRHAHPPSQTNQTSMSLSPRQHAIRPNEGEAEASKPKLQARVDSLRGPFAEFSLEQLPEIVVEDGPEVVVDSASIRAPIPVNDSDQSPSRTTRPKWGPGSMGAYKNENDYMAGLLAFAESQKSSDIGNGQLEGWYGKSADEYIADGQRSHPRHRRTTSEPEQELTLLSPTRPSGLRTRSESGPAMRSRISRLWQRRATSKASQIIEDS